MQTHTSWFSLIEIIIATIVLTIGVFGIYRLIGNNMNLLHNYSKTSQMQTLGENLKECTRYLGYNSFSWFTLGEQFSINFWDDNLDCRRSSYNGNYTFSWVILDGEVYYLYGQVKTKDMKRKRIYFTYNVFSESVGKLFPNIQKEFYIEP